MAKLDCFESTFCSPVPKIVNLISLLHALVVILPLLFPSPPQAALPQSSLLLLRQHYHTLPFSSSGSITTVMVSADERSNEFRHRVETLNEFSETKEIPPVSPQERTLCGDAEVAQGYRDSPGTVQGTVRRVGWDA
eukprot:1136694-Pelagomonas_calceolata.AAC.2